MRATDIIRGILDLIDHVECAQDPQPEVVASVSVEEPVQTGVDTNRFKQIFAMISDQQPQMYDNSPAEVTAGIESVTTNAGGGWNGPKNPADIRADSVAMYPSQVYGAK